MRLIWFYILICFGKLNSQNLISNSSFSEVNIRKNNNIQYQLLPGKLSDIKGWYLPTYINYKKHHLVSQFTSLYGYTYYFTSRDKDIFLNEKHYSNSEQLFENNLGFIYLHINYLRPKATIQQQLNKTIKKGQYCFKFKYKFVKVVSKGDVKLEFCFSPTDLKEYYKDKLKVPINMINILFRDTLTDGDKNTPWQQKSFILNLNGNEKYLTFGGLSNPNNFNTADYYIDDIELYPLSDTVSCNCEKVNKDLTTFYNKEFALNEVISSDTMVMYRPHNSFAPGIISPEAREYLRNIIAFMQRNPDIKIEFIEFNQDINPTLKPTNYHEFKRYLMFFGINNSRISAEIKLCYDSTGIYCGPKSELVKIGFKFY